MNKVILSTKLMLGQGIFASREISLEEAKMWVKTNAPKNFCGHETVKILGLQPAVTRETCQGYDEALCLVVNGRLEFGREYSIEEIQEIGVIFTLVKFWPTDVADMELNRLTNECWQAGLQNYPIGQYTVKDLF